MRLLVDGAAEAALLAPTREKILNAFTVAGAAGAGEARPVDLDVCIIGSK